MSTWAREKNKMEKSRIVLTKVFFCDIFIFGGNKKTLREDYINGA